MHTTVYIYSRIVHMKECFTIYTYFFLKGIHAHINKFII